MKDKIFEILDAEDLNDPFAYGSTNLYKASERIETFIKENYYEKEFVEWLQKECYVIWRYDDVPLWRIRDDKSHTNYDNQGLYKYWLKNIKDVNNN